MSPRAAGPVPPGASTQDPVAFFETVYRVFERAVRAAGHSVDRWYRIAGYPVRLRFAGSTLVPFVAPALEHLAATPHPHPALTVCLWDVESMLPDVPAPPWRMGGDANRWEARRYCDERVQFDFDVATGVLSMRDAARHLGVYCVRDARRLPGYERGAPLKQLLHWTMRSRGKQLIHAAAVGHRRGGVLLVGKGGFGKSTAALTCLGTELLYAADDHCLLSMDPSPYVHSLYNCVKLYAEDFRRFPVLAATPRILDAPGTDKALSFLYRDHRDRLAAGFPIRAILVPQVTGCPETTLCPVSPATAMRALAPSTVFPLARADHATLGILAACVKRVPCYALRLGSMLSTIPRAIQDVLRETPGAV